MKTDNKLHSDVIDELAWDPQLRDAEIGVAVKSGVVTLSGTVKSYAQKLAAHAAAERVSGVKALADDLMVRPLTSKPTDTEIAHAAVNALYWDTEVPNDRITVKVEDGWVTLEGIVPWRYQSESSERAVRYLGGVKGVSNHIKVQPAISTAEVKNKIENALKRSAELDAKRISVEAADGKVTLKGTVRTWAERRDAERAAWSAPGVRQVEDMIVVGA